MDCVATGFESGAGLQIEIQEAFMWLRMGSAVGSSVGSGFHWFAHCVTRGGRRLRRACFLHCGVCAD